MTSIRSGCAIPAFLLRTFSLVFAIICWVTPVHADQSQSFVWVADTRGDANNDIIDKAVLTPIVNSILALNPAPNVVIFGGDAAYRGGTANLTEFEKVFTNPLTAAKIPSAFAIGNHELYTTGDSAQYLSRQQDFQTLFNSNWPQNGPSGYNNLAFSFQIGNSLFIIADSFYATSNATEPSYGVSAAQQAWMTGLLQNDTASNIFVFTHVPAFTAVTPSQTPDSDMATAWDTITTAGSATNTDASILFAGHEHLYYRAFRDGTYQVLAGSGGAPLGCDVPPCPPYGPLQPGDVRELSYNWAVVSINGRNVTVTVFDQANNVLDSFQFFNNSGVANSVINNTTPIVGPQAAGILASSGNTINNSANISNVNTGIDAVSNNTITNSGKITPAASGNGIYVYDNNKITNTAAGSITGNSTGLWGIRVNTGNTVVNHGAVAVSGTNSIAFLAEGDSNTLTNNGILSASGTDSYAAKFLGKGNTLLNTGAVSGNVRFAAGGANAFNNAQGAEFDPGSTVDLGGGKLTNNGVISPGGWGNLFSLSNGNGPTTVTGNFEHGSTGNYYTDLRFLTKPSLDWADRINVTGTAAVNGQVSPFINDPGMARPQSTSQVILNAVGGVTNNGLTLNPWSLNGPALPTAVFTPSLGFDSNNVYLDYTVNFAPVGLTWNQTQVGTAINAIQTAGVANFQPIAARIFWVPNVTAAGQTYDSLSGEGTSAAQQAVFNSRGQFFDAALSQAALLLDSGPTQYALAGAAPVAIPMLAGWRVWATGFGNGGNLDGSVPNPGSARATFTNGGGSAGIDYRVSPNILVGFAAGGAEASFDVSHRYTHGSASGVNLGLYGMARLGRGVYAQGVLSYGYYSNDIRRSLVGENIGPTENARSSFGSNLFGGRFEAGWKKTFGRVNLTPFASIQFDALWQNAYSESTVVNGTTMPGIMGLHYSSHNVTSVPLSLGLQVDGSFPVGGDSMTITPSARISWVHEFESTRAINAAFLAAPDFAFGVRGAAAAENAARVDAGLLVRFSPQFGLYGNFVGTFSGAGITVGGLGGLKYRF